MRLIAEEKRNRTLDLLRSRPVSVLSILFSKWLATLVYIIIILISTLIYIYSIYILGSPVGNIDMRVVALTYIALILLSAIFVASGILASSLTDNQIIAFVLALALNFILFFGLDMIVDLVTDSSIKARISDFSLSFHADRMKKGILYLNDITLFISYFALLFLFSNLSLDRKQKFTICTLAMVSIIALIINLLQTDIRFDLTKDKRYTIAPVSVQLMNNIKHNNNSLKINIFLDGNLNYGLQRLQRATSELLDELNEKTGYHLSISTIDPLSLGVNREQLPVYMTSKSMPPVQLNEVDRNGKISQQFIYPYSQIIHKEDTLVVALLKNIQGNTAAENLNTSIEDLEFQFVDAIQLLLNKNEQDIAFIEGHGELPRAYVYEAEEALAKYYNINRGQITNNISVLDNFKVVIIAGPTEKYSETEKFVLDQYLMKGGRILWIIDGAYVSYKDLTEKGESPSMKNDINMDDMLFNYGVRINADFVQDAMCLNIPAPANDGSIIHLPWYYSPILLPSTDNYITKDIANVKSSFASSLQFVSPKSSITPKVLLTTAHHSHLVRVPEMISLQTEDIQSNKEYFDTSFIPIAISLEGVFTSAFVNRIAPDSIYIPKEQIIWESKPTRMIVVSSSDIIRNDVEGHGESTRILPLGYDRLSGKTFGNKEFIVNAVKWLSGDDSRMQLRSRSQQMNLLDKQKIYENRNKHSAINILSPVILMVFITAIFYIYRKRKYS